MLTCSCSIDSSEIGATLVRSPGCAPRPKEVLKYEPSTVMLLRRLSWPAKELPDACGVRRVRSPMRPVIVGSNAISERLTDVAAPVRAELKTVSDCAVTVTVSCTEIERTVIGRSVATPRLTCTSDCVNGSKGAGPAPGKREVTGWGPPA